MRKYFNQLPIKETNDTLVSLRAVAEKDNVPIITKEGMRFLQQLITMTNTRFILEIGTAIGYSALAMASINKNLHITTIERDPAMITQAKKQFAVYDIYNQITLIEGDALKIDYTGPALDMIFIDAAKAQSIKFFERFERYLKHGGIIVTDNLLFHGLFDEDGHSKNVTNLLKKIDDFNHYILNKETYDTAIYQLGDGMSVSIKKR
ncbi:MAG: O-methyltransferase [Bacillota bacterium]